MKLVGSKVGNFSVYHLENKDDAEEFCRFLLLPNSKYTDSLTRLLSSCKGFTVIVEENYFDKDWTSIFSHHYSTIYGRYPRCVTRLHIFQGTHPFEILEEACSFQSHYVGYINIYPTRPRVIGRTLLSPKIYFENPTVMYYEEMVHIAGNELKIRGFPFTGQDGKVVSCAHVACWEIVRYLSGKYGYYGEYFLSDIAVQAEDSRFGRPIPTKGLNGGQILSALRSFRLSPTIYWISNDLCREKAIEYAIGYLLSGIPIILLGDMHAIVGIGLASTDPNDKSIIVNDDNYLPYGIMKLDTTHNVRFPLNVLNGFIAPLYHKIIVPFETALNFSEKFGRIDLFGLTKNGLNGNLMSRTFLTSSKSYLKSLALRQNQNEFERIVRTRPLPKFIWITEFYQESNPFQIHAEYLFDATTSEHDPFPFLYLNYPNLIWVNKIFDEPSDSVCFTSPIEKKECIKSWEAFPGNLFWKEN
ncbi:MAG: hypothetical protein N2450_06845 [bacterium]|nr:hypothetical protein [bacterium]